MVEIESTVCDGASLRVLRLLVFGGVVKLRVLNPDNNHHTPEMIAARERRMKTVAREDTEISMVCQSRTQIVVDGALDEAITAPELIEHALEAEREGCDVIGLYCSGDPAIEAIREAVRIPVIGCGQTSLQVAMGLGDRISWISSAESTVRSWRFIESSGIAPSRIASVRTAVFDLTELHSITEEMILGKLLDTAWRCVEEDGAQVIIPGCLLFAGFGRALTQRLGIPVIDPALVLVSMAELLHYNGLSHSIAAYPAAGKQVRSWQSGHIDL